MGSTCSFSLVVATRLLLVYESDSVVSSSDSNVAFEDLLESHGGELVRANSPCDQRSHLL